MTPKAIIKVEKKIPLCGSLITSLFTAMLLLSGCGGSGNSSSGTTTVDTVSSSKQSVGGGEYTITLPNEGSGQTVDISFTSTANLPENEIADLFGAEISSNTPAGICDVQENAAKDSYTVTFDSSGSSCSLLLYSTIKSPTETEGTVTFTSSSNDFNPVSFNYTNHGYLLAGGQSENVMTDDKYYTYNVYTDGSWQGTAYYATGLDYVIHAIVVSKGGKFYAGGRSVNKDCDNGLSYCNFIDSNVWVSVPSTANGLDGAIYALTIGDDGTIYAGGRSENMNCNNNSSYCTFNSYNPDSEEWGTANAANGLDGTVYAIAISADSKNLYAGGMSNTEACVDSPNGSNTNCTFNTYNISSNEWTTTAQAANGVDEVIHALLVDSDGTVYVGGVSKTNSPSNANYTFSYYKNSQWHEQADSSLTEKINALSLEETGSTVYAGGKSISNTCDNGLCTFDSYTNESWSNNLSSVSGLDDHINVIVVDSYGNVYAGGRSSAQSCNNGSSYCTFNIYTPKDGWSSNPNTANGLDGEIYALAFSNTLVMTRKS